MINAEGSFKNVIEQLRVLNPSVEFNMTGMRLLYYVVDDKIVVSEFLKGFIKASVGEPSQRDHIPNEMPQLDI